MAVGYLHTPSGVQFGLNFMLGHKLTAAHKTNGGWFSSDKVKITVKEVDGGQEKTISAGTYSIFPFSPL